jgi:hypothetical protein
MPRRGFLRDTLFFLFLLALGSQFWPGAPLEEKANESLLLWVLILFAGNGFESFRVNLMDDSWHGRLVWFLLGLGVFTGIVQ